MFEHKKLSRDAAPEAEVERQANEAIAKGEVCIGERLKKKAREYAKALEAV